MSFRFLHTADLHLGSPLRGLRALAPGVAERFEDATRRAFRDLVDRAIDAGVAFAVIAGDVFDGPWLDHATGLFYAAEIARLGRAGIPVYTLRGNHDAESVVTQKLRAPANLHEFSTRKPESFALRDVPVVLHGRGFATREASEDLSADYPARVEGRFNIGVLHTSLDGRPGHAPYAPTTPARLAAKAYDYWALGHVHAHEIVGRDPWIVYPGVLQGRHVGESGAKGAVLVSVDDALQVESVERLIVDRARFAVVPVDLAGVDGETAMLDAVEAALASTRAEAGDRMLAARVRLLGETSLHRRLIADLPDARAQIAAVAGQVGEDLVIESLEVRTRMPVDRSSTAALAEDLVDAEALIADAAADPEFASALAAALEPLLGKLREEAKDAAGLSREVDFAPLIAEARDLVLGRLAGPAP